MKSVHAKSYDQVKAIFGAAKECGIDPGEPLRDVVEDVTRRTRSIKALTHAEAEKVIKRLKGDSFVPTRTLQWRRQKAGIKQLVQDSQLTLIARLASQRDGWTGESMTKFCRKMIKRDRPITTDEANKIIEALKAMNRRDRLWAA